MAHVYCRIHKLANAKRSGARGFPLRGGESCSELAFFFLLSINPGRPDWMRAEKKLFYFSTLDIVDAQVKIKRLGALRATRLFRSALIVFPRRDKKGLLCRSELSILYQWLSDAACQWPAVTKLYPQSDFTGENSSFRCLIFRKKNHQQASVLV